MASLNKTWPTPAITYRKIAWVITPEGVALFLEPLDNCTLAGMAIEGMSFKWPIKKVCLN